MIVLDTNLLVAAMWSRTGASSKIVELALRQKIEIAVSVALALEYEDVLNRAKMRERSWASQDELDIILDALFRVAHRMAPITERMRPILKDADDDMVLECAVQAKASAILTMNIRDFTGVEERFGIRVVQPGYFYAEYVGRKI